MEVNALLVSLMMREGPVVFVEVGLVGVGWDGSIIAMFGLKCRGMRGREGTG